jgi:hypothetical protein
MMRGNGWMRIYAPDGEYLGATPIKDGKPCDGSYGLVEYLAEEGVDQDSEEGKLNQYMADKLEADLRRQLNEDPEYMAHSMGFSAIYLKDEQPYEFLIDTLSEGEWTSSGEGPFDTTDDACKFAENEVGVPFRIIPRLSAD